jgi:hypothetical protein
MLASPVGLARLALHRGHGLHDVRTSLLVRRAVP